MENKTVLRGFLLISLIFSLLLSCSPVSNDDIAAPDFTVDEESIHGVSASWNERGITASFPAVDEARSYGYTFDADTDPIAGKVEFHPRSGRYTMLIPLPEREKTEYDITIWASSAPVPSAVADPGWQRVRSNLAVRYSEVDINSIEPHGYVVERGEDYAEIAVIDEPKPGEMSYKVLFPDGEELEFRSVSSFTLEGIGRSRQEIQLFHSYGDDVYGELPETIVIEQYTAPAVLSLNLSGDNLSVSGIPSGYRSVEIMNTETRDVLASAAVSGSSYTFTPSSFEGFDSGVFCAVATGPEGMVVSPSIPYTVPLEDMIVSHEVMRQHYKVTIRVPENIDTSMFYGEITNEPTAGFHARFNDEKELELIISGLSSDTSYRGGKITVGDEEIIIPQFTTDDFTGTYAYRCPEKNPDRIYMDAFIVDIRFAKDENPGSQSKYYFYASPEDPANTEKRSDMRISPLIDGEVAIGTEIQYEGNTPYQRTYQWNNGKWNTSTAVVNYWKVVSYTAAADSYSAVNSSNATMSGLPAVSADTTSSYTLTEDEDGNASLIFFNKITSTGMAAVGNTFIRKNIAPEPELKALFGSDDKYAFILEMEATI